MSGLDYLESPMFWLKRAFLAARKTLDEGLAQHHLTGSQLEVLRHVLSQDGIEQRALQERLKVSSATVTGLVDGLVSRGLVRRELHAADARVKRLFITPEGSRVGAAFGQKAVEVEEQLLQGFSPAERTLVREWLQRMAANLGPVTDETCP